jgi:very-short-patch-repair endonuclease
VVVNKNVKYLPYNPELKEKARDLRKNSTAAEKKLWRDVLKNCKYKFTRQKPIGNFIVDFYCSKLGLVIEIDGTTHLETKEIFYDQQRTAALEKYGLKVLRFWNNDVLTGTHIVKEIIDKEINNITHPSPPLSGRG